MGTSVMRRTPVSVFTGHTIWPGHLACRPPPLVNLGVLRSVESEMEAEMEAEMEILTEKRWSGR